MSDISYADEWFAKADFEKVTEDRVCVVYRLYEPNERAVTMLTIANESVTPGQPPYFRYSIKGMLVVGDVTTPIDIFDDELEHLQMKAKEMMKKFLEPMIKEEVGKIRNYQIPAC